MKMNYLAVKDPAIGYGRLGVKLRSALERAGIELYDDLPDPYGMNAKFIVPGQRSGVCSHVSWVSTPAHCRGFWRGQTTSLLTMWESNTLPEPMRESLDVWDTLVVPSEQNQELFSRYHGNVHYVPLGIDPDEWHPIARPTLNSPTFRFFTSGGGRRKGSDLVIEAFRKVFQTWPDDMPIPELFLHTAKASEVPNDDRIHLITGKLEAEEERALYASAHAFIYPSRGEGFGLRPLQALAQGCPTVATDAHGHKAYSHLLNVAIPWTLEETPPQSFHHGPAGSWWEPDFDVLCEAMEDIYFNYEKHLEIAATNGARAVQELNWDETARGYLDAIGRENLEMPDVVPTEWIEPPQRKYLTRVNSTRRMEVGGIQYRLEPFRWEKCDADDEDALPAVEAFGEPGEVPVRLVDATHVKKVMRDYYEPADVKRILFEGGHLDISCLPQNLPHDIDLGLTPEQMQGLDFYRASHAMCPACGQKLNTNPMSMDELLALPMPREP